MKTNLYTTTAITFIYIILSACTSQNAISTEEQKVVGIWYHGIRPGAIKFEANKTYKNYLPSEAEVVPDIDTGEVALRGTWTLEKNKLTMIDAETKKALVQEIHWEDENTFSFGKFDGKEFSSKDAFMDEHGMFRATTPISASTTETTLEADNQTEKFIGTWNFGHEPGAMDFNSDGTFRDYAPAGALDPESPEETYRTGTWELKDGQLNLKLTDGTLEVVNFSFVKPDLLFLGNLEEEYDANSGTKEDYANEMGWHKAK